LFGANPMAHQANGSLWTIPYEAAMYIGVAAAGASRLLRFPWLASLVIAAICAAFAAWPVHVGVPNSYGIPLLGLALAGCFGAGSIACLLRAYVPISSGIMIVLAIIALAAHDTVLIWPAVLYFVFWFAYVPRIPRIPRQLDLSYGTYLWAFPVQQSIIQLAGVTNPLGLFAVATPIVLLIAAASWLCVEQPALRLKRGRGRDAHTIAAAPIADAVSR
jgi:peptidoglycan/LPS O-acetylase OafA/YrhL